MTGLFMSIITVQIYNVKSVVILSPNYMIRDKKICTKKLRLESNMN